MKKSEAIEHMKKGAKVIHRFFLPEEYIGMNAAGEIYTENPNELPVPQNWFWEPYRNSIGWEDGWSIFKNIQNQQS